MDQLQLELKERGKNASGSREELAERLLKLDQGDVHIKIFLHGHIENYCCNGNVPVTFSFKEFCFLNLEFIFRMSFDFLHHAKECVLYI